MKLKVKVKRINKNLEFPTIIKKGDWIDLRSSETVHLKAPQSGVLERKMVDGVRISSRDVTFDTYLIRLGVAMQLPKGYEAQVVSRSSTLDNFGVILANAVGIIDNTYCGGEDEWRYKAIAFRDTTINEGDRICQFKIVLSQKATMWQKIKWLFTSGIKFKEVEELKNPNREGIGSTGKQ